MSRVSSLLLLVFWLCSCGPSFAFQVREVRGDFAASTSQAKFVKALARALDPDSMVVTFVDGPKENGELSGVYIDVTGLSGGTSYRLDRLTLSGALIRLTPPAQWDVEDLKTFRPQKWEGLFDAELILKKSTAQEVLRVFSQTRKDEKWRDLAIDFKPGRLVLKGTYRVRSGIRAVFKITTGLDVRRGKQIWLANTEVQINNDEQTQAIRKEIQKINPPVDCEKLGIPFVLRSAVVTNEELRIATGKPPRPLEGDTWKYVR